MNFDEAEKYRDENMNVIGEHLHDDLSFRIESLLIAPKERSFEDRMKVLAESYTELGNKNALIKLGFINDNLDVYIISSDERVKREYLLYNYLSRKNTKS